MPAIDLASSGSRALGELKYREEGLNGARLLELSVSPTYRYIGRLLEVLAEEKVLSVRDVEEILGRHGLVLDVIGQERGLWKGVDKGVRKKIVSIVASRSLRERDVGTRKSFNNLFGVFMIARSREVFLKYDPLTLRIKKTRLNATSEFIVLLRKGVESSDKLSELLLGLAEGYKSFAVATLRGIIGNPKRYGREVVDAARTVLERLEKLDPKKLLLPPYGEEHPSIIAVVPFRYSLEMLAELGHISGDDEAARVLLSEVGRILRARPVVTGLKLHHLFMAVGCRHSGALKMLSRIEDKLVKKLGYANALDLVLSESEAHKTIVDAIKNKHPELMKLLREHCGESLEKLQDLFSEIRDLAATRP